MPAERSPINGSNPFRYGPCLSPLRPAPRPQESAAILVLVTLPWLLPVEKWFICCGESHEDLIGNVPVYAFQEWSNIADDFRWEDVKLFGGRLAEWLLSLCTSSEGASRTIVVMAHSLAGLVLKQCMVLVHTQKHKYRAVKNAINSIIFLGTPHYTSSHRSAVQEKAAHILQLGGDSRRNNRQSDFDVLVGICSTFEEIIGSISILSFYETKTSARPKINGLIKGTSEHLVDKDLATIGSAIEQTSDIATDHRSLPSLRSGSPPSPPDRRAPKLIRRTVEHAGEAALPSQETGAQARATHLQGLSERSATGLTVMSLATTTLADPDPDGPALEPMIENFPPSRLFPKLPCSMLEITRQRNGDFHGREGILNQLEEHLVRKSQVAVVHGLGGIGKSDVAMEFLYRHRSQFDAIFWIQSDDVAKMRQTFGRIARELGLEDATKPLDAHSSRDTAKAWLADPIKAPSSGVSSQDKAKWLVVFDGVGKASTVQEFQPIFCQGSVLITTQNPELAKEIQCDQKAVLNLKLDFFDMDEGVALLQKLVATDGFLSDEEHEAAREIIQRTGYGVGWPLAITTYAGMIRHKYNISLTEFRDLHTDSDNRELDCQDASRAIIASTMKLARLSAHATALLQVFAMLDPDCIQEALFTKALSVNPVPTAKLLQAFPSTKVQFADARAELIRSSLVRRNPQKQALWMHRVVRDTVRHQCTVQTLDAAFRTAAILVSYSWDPPDPQLRDNLKLWQPCAEFLRHVVHMQFLYEQKFKTGIIKASVQFAWLLSETASYHANLGDTKGLKDTLDLALQICNDLPRGEMFNLLSDIHHSLGAWANETNHPDLCLDYNKKYLEMRLEAVRAGADADERTAAAWNQYGTGLMMVRRYQEAMKAFQTSIDLYGTVKSVTLCPDSLPTANLAVAKCLAKDYDGALSLLLSGLLAREEAFGYMDVDSFRTGRILHALGNVRWDQGNYKDSKTYHRRALKQYIESLGKSNHRTADVRHRVAMHCLRDREHENAGSLIDQALESWRLDADSFRQEIARTTWLKAQQTAQAGNPFKAMELREEAFILRRVLIPDDTRGVGELTNDDFDDLVAFWSR